MSPRQINESLVLSGPTLGTGSRGSCPGSKTGMDRKISIV